MCERYARSINFLTLRSISRQRRNAPRYGSLERSIETWNTKPEVCKTVYFVAASCASRRDGTTQIILTYANFRGGQKVSWRAWPDCHAKKNVHPFLSRGFLAVGRHGSTAARQHDGLVERTNCPLFSFIRPASLAASGKISLFGKQVERCVRLSKGRTYNSARARQFQHFKHALNPRLKRIPLNALCNC